ncbi:hypothetical protein MRB53_014062 [Persea americana]|uniref:Uncharacterized protein n=1 Tax=Persea americana TaxID=3435 RepID=A0ACC2K9X5_PERAE|nr:hypothetical protein MRB53_014062 [Persea americana]
MPSSSLSLTQKQIGDHLTALNLNLSLFPQLPPSSQGRNWADLFPNPQHIHPSSYPPSWKEGKLAVKIPSHMIEPSKNSFSNSAMGRFLGRRPTVEWLQQHTQTHWNLSRPCLISVTEKGHLDGICSRSAKTREDIPIEVQNREGILGKVPSSSNVFGSSIVSIPGITKVPENAKSAQVTHGSSQHVVSQQQSPATSQYLASQPLHLGGSTTSTQSQSVSFASTSTSKPQLPVQPQKPVADFFATRLASLPRDIILNILSRIQGPQLNLSNPFSVLEHCTCIDPITAIPHSRPSSVAILPAHQQSSALNLDHLQLSQTMEASNQDSQQ